MIKFLFLQSPIPNTELSSLIWVVKAFVCALFWLSGTCFELLFIPQRLVSIVFFLANPPPVDKAHNDMIFILLKEFQNAAVKINVPFE